MDLPDVQIWNNAAFEDSFGVKNSWSSSSNLVQDSDSAKENDTINSSMEVSPQCFKTPMPASIIKPLQPNSAILNSIKPLLIAKQSEKQETERNLFGNEDASVSITDEDSKIDAEIDDLQKEIKRLSMRLEALKLEKAKRKKTERRIVQRRGVSMCPSEILFGMKYHKLNNINGSNSKSEMLMTMTPSERRKSCFWKLGEIDELKVTKERTAGGRKSLSPRKAAIKVNVPKQSLTTIGLKKMVKKDDGIVSLVQPKELFKDGEKSASASVFPSAVKKTFKPGRVVPSRYNSANGNSASAVRKRSLSENDKDESKKFENKRVSIEKSNAGQGMVESSRVKKKWEIPSEIVVYKSADEEEESPPSISKIAVAIPKIKTVRYVNETPRDSGAAKRVAALVGRKSFFEVDKETEPSLYQALSFVEDDEES